MFEMISGVVILVLCYFTGYIVSRYATVIPHNKSDKSEDNQAFRNNRKEAIRSRLVRDSVLLRQCAHLYKSLVLTIATLTGAFLLWRIFGEDTEALPLLLVLVLFLAWFGQVLFVEYIPRRLSRSSVSDEKIHYLWFLWLVLSVLGPLINLYRLSIRGSGGNGNVSEEAKEEIVERAIESLADEAGIDEAIIEEEEKEMIGHIFELDQTVVREIMIPRTQITAIELGSSLNEIKALVKEDGHSRFPVYSDTIDSITGILYVKDLFSAKSPWEGEFDLSRYLRKPFVVPESKIISELLREFKSRKVHIAMVVDEYGGVAGLVTLEDILEEIVGEIRDEHDNEEDDVRQQADGSYCVNADMLLEDLQEYLHTEYDQGEYDSVGGLIYDLVGSVPGEGTRVKWNDLEFEIDKVEGQRITGIKVRRHSPGGSDTIADQASGA